MQKRVSVEILYKWIIRDLPKTLIISRQYCTNGFEEALEYSLVLPKGLASRMTDENNSSPG